jgi:hypothetical protein
MHSTGIVLGADVCGRMNTSILKLAAAGGSAACNGVGSNDTAAERISICFIR